MAIGGSDTRVVQNPVQFSQKEFRYQQDKTIFYLIANRIGFPTWCQNSTDEHNDIQNNTHFSLRPALFALF